MKIAFSARGSDMNALVDPRFGRAAYLVVFDEESAEVSNFDNSAISSVAHGAGLQTAQKLVDMEANVLITGNGPGGNASTVLKKSNVKVFVGAAEMTLHDAYDAYKKNALKEF